MDQWIQNIQVAFVSTYCTCTIFWGPLLHTLNIAAYCISQFGFILGGTRVLFLGLYFSFAVLLYLHGEFNWKFVPPSPESGDQGALCVIYIQVLYDCGLAALFLDSTKANDSLAN
jgi:hypothetical protein